MAGLIHGTDSGTGQSIHYRSLNGLQVCFCLHFSGATIHGQGWVHKKAYVCIAQAISWFAFRRGAGTLQSVIIEQNLEHCWDLEFFLVLKVDMFVPTSLVPSCLYALG